MRAFLSLLHGSLPHRLGTRALCKGSTVILGICAVLGTMAAVAFLVARLAPST
jgi:hypothetical protein